MPISKSSKKSLRKSIKNRKSNLVLKDKFKEIVKKFLANPDAKKVAGVQSILDKAVKKGLLHKNKVARMKSQVSKKVGKAVEVKKVVKKKVAKKVAKK
jgi:small subunit ribosomal protein S20